MRSICSAIIFSIVVLVSFSGCKKDKQAEASGGWENVSINQIQVVGSHNSYRLRTNDSIFNLVQSLKGSLPAEYNPDGWDYTHLPFDEQFNDYGIRGLEIDIYWDPNGGRFYNRAGLSLVGLPIESGIQELNQPGYKVLHIPDMDYNTHFLTFRKALQAVKDWSDAHPRHIPIHIYVETKQSTAGDQLPLVGFVKGIPYTSQSCIDLDNEIKDVFGANLDKVITPDDVRGTYASLNEAVLAGNWPKLKDARGKVIFVMNGGAMNIYRQGLESLEGRAMFVFASRGDKDAAFVIRNNAPGNENAIADLVRQGYIVRTRADGDTKEARTGDYSRSIAAFGSGAQIVSTDYYKPDFRCDTSSVFTCYKIALPGGSVGRISPAFAGSVTVEGALTE